MLKIERASFGYKGPTGTKVVLRDVELTLKKGQLICLLGANGAGKTTVFRTILGSIPLLEGQITVDGIPSKELSRRALAKKIAYVPQQHVPPFPYTVLQVVEMGRCVHIGSFSSPSPRDEMCAVEMLRRLGIEALWDTAYTELSGGERQLVLIARALAQQAEYLLLDEPAASLDYGNQARLLQEIQHLTDTGIGVCIILHDPEQALRLNRDVAVILDGRIRVFGKAGEVIDPPLLQKLYGMKTEMKAWVAADGALVRSIHPCMSQRKESEMESKFSVEGIMCPNCVKKVTGALTAVTGVDGVSVSEDFKTVTITHDAAVTPERIKDAIEAIDDKKFTVIGQL